MDLVFGSCFCTVDSNGELFSLRLDAVSSRGTVFQYEVSLLGEFINFVMPFYSKKINDELIDTITVDSDMVNWFR